MPLNRDRMDRLFDAMSHWSQVRDMPYKGWSAKQLARIMGWHPKTVRHYLDCLEAMGKVITERVNRPTRAQRRSGYQGYVWVYRIAEET